MTHAEQVAPAVRDGLNPDRVEASQREGLLLTLLSGQTQRWHTHPFMPTQNVADHSWHVALILAYIDPDCTVEDLKTALYHDVAELKHGDISALRKRADESLSASIREAETETLRRWTGHDHQPTPALAIANKLSDLWQFAIQSRLGNKEAASGFAKHNRWLQDMNLAAYPNAEFLSDTIKHWHTYGSLIIEEEIT